VCAFDVTGFGKEYSAFLSGVPQFLWVRFSCLFMLLWAVALPKKLDPRFFPAVPRLERLDSGKVPVIQCIPFRGKNMPNIHSGGGIFLRGIFWLSLEVEICSFSSSNS
jgi:hypothetical protein